MECVEIKTLDHQGRGISKIDNKTVFVSNALPNEVVEIEITNEKKKFCEASVNKILQKSPKRIESICPYFNVCGGCDLLHISYEEQLKYKQVKIVDIMQRYCQVEFPIKDIISSDNFYYRNKVVFHVVDNKLGYYKEKSNDLIEIDKCLLLDNAIDDIYQLIKNINLKNILDITIRYSLNNKEIMVILSIVGNIDENMWINTLKEKVSSIIVEDNNNFKTIYGKDYIIEKLFDYNFIIKNDSFFQVNTKQTEKLYSKALEYADINDNDIVLDLYCGTGTIGILASKTAKKVIGIEINEEAVKSANKNKELNNVTNIEFYAGDTGTILSKHNYKVDTVIVDPPRAGLNDTAIKEILSINPKKIVYVSCDPMTLARDLNILSENYNIVELTTVDMFPNTAHVECVVELNKKKRDD